MKSPPKSPSDRRRKDQKRVPLSMRITPKVREWLEKEAADSGRSLTQEAEFRLEQSLQEEKRIPDAMRRIYGSQLAGFLLLIGGILREVGPQIGYGHARTLEKAHNWFDLRFAFDQAKDAIDLVMKALRPAKPPEHAGEALELNDLELELKRREREMALDYAKAALRNVVMGSHYPVGAGSDAAEIRELIGPAASRIPANLGEELEE
jgi:hypothetical protein